MLTNTLSVGVVRDATAEWLIRRGYPSLFSALPVVAETWDGALSDAEGFHVKKEHAFDALDSASDGKIEEGNVGGGTGMICYGYKGGIGTSSRLVSVSPEDNFTIGVIVQANHGSREQTANSRFTCRTNARCSKTNR